MNQIIPNYIIQRILEGVVVYCDCVEHLLEFLKKFTLISKQWNISIIGKLHNRHLLKISEYSNNDYCLLLKKLSSLYGFNIAIKYSYNKPSTKEQSILEKLFCDDIHHYTINTIETIPDNQTIQRFKNLKKMVFHNIQPDSFLNIDWEWCHQRSIELEITHFYTISKESVEQILNNFKVVSLSRVYFNYQDLKILPPQSLKIKELELKSLNISTGTLSELFSKLPRLEVLKLQHTSFIEGDDQFDRIITPILRELPLLNELSIFQQQNTSLKAIKNLVTNTRVKILSLTLGTLTISDPQELEFHWSNTHLEQVEIDNCRIDNQNSLFNNWKLTPNIRELRLFDALSDDYVHSTMVCKESLINLKTLDIYIPQYHKPTLQFLNSVISMNLENLVELYFDYIDEDYIYSSYQEIKESLKLNSHIRKLVLTEMYFADIIEFLNSNHCSIRQLRIDTLQIREQLYSSLWKSIQDNNTLNSVKIFSFDPNISHFDRMGAYLDIVKDLKYDNLQCIHLPYGKPKISDKAISILSELSIHLKNQYHIVHLYLGGPVPLSKFLQKFTLISKQWNISIIGKLHNSHVIRINDNSNNDYCLLLKKLSSLYGFNIAIKYICNKPSSEEQDPLVSLFCDNIQHYMINTQTKIQSIQRFKNLKMLTLITSIKEPNFFVNIDWEWCHQRSIELEITLLNTISKESVEQILNNFKMVTLIHGQFDFQDLKLLPPQQLMIQKIELKSLTTTIQVLAELFSKLPRLEILTLSYMGFNGGDKVDGIFTKILSDLPQLNELTIFDNQKIQLKSIKDLVMNTRVKILKLALIFLKTSETQELEFQWSNTHLEQVEMEDCRIGRKNCLFNHWKLTPNIRCIKLYDALSDDYDYSTMLCRDSLINLKKLDVNMTEYKKSTLQFLNSIIRMNLENLDEISFDFLDEGVNPRVYIYQDIKESFNLNTHIRKLELPDINFTDLNEFLESNHCSIRHLRIEYLEIEKELLPSFWKSIQNNKTLNSIKILNFYPLIRQFDRIEGYLDIMKDLENDNLHSIRLPYGNLKYSEDKTNSILSELSIHLKNHPHIVHLYIGKHIPLSKRLFISDE
ncbi:hypothetical protein DLAC_09707 [Tieghemostelium lacteum]|uniref:Uncharacterized protein n=1 Tax=Tieghemostelium lacteum TaxID=361077 RepID=A0A151Z700_TIELA|nr:hypothetical protein DLAC_09707 [Tieghemostelium lacteum]|eukprot:KYQ89739.1 hypothetical protein DLAC_09707 [Tieghemostelium lacteum]